MEKGGFVPHKHFTEEEKIGGVFGSGKRRAVPGLATRFFIFIFYFFLFLFFSFSLADYSHNKQPKYKNKKQ